MSQVFTTLPLYSYAARARWPKQHYTGESNYNPLPNPCLDPHPDPYRHSGEDALMAQAGHIDHS